MNTSTGAQLKVLECLGVSVEFGKALAVSHVSLSVGAGELVGLIGPVGSGKTTLLRALAGIQKIASGSIHVHGKGNGLGKTLVGFAPAEAELDGTISVRESLLSVARSAGLRTWSAEERVEQWLEKTQLIGVGYSRIKDLSRSMKQRLCIARVLLPEPSLVLLDEPAAGLDSTSRAHFCHFLTDLRKQGKAIIVTSTALSHVNESCTHIAMMNHGKVVGMGKVREVPRELEASAPSYRVSLSRPVFNLPSAIAAIDGVVLTGIDRLNCTLKYAVGDAASLLDALIMHNIPVASFMQTPEDAKKAQYILPPEITLRMPEAV